MLKRAVIFGLSFLTLASVQARADQALPQGLIANDGTVKFGPLTLGKRQSGKTTLTPDALQIQGPGSTGPIDGTSATAPGASAARTMSDLVGFAAGNTATIATLRGLGTAPLLGNAVVAVSGYGVAGDGGGGLFSWVPASTATDDACMAIKPTAVSGAGRWLRNLNSGAVLPAAACGVSSANADNTAAIQAANNACKGRGVEGKPLCSVSFPAGDIKHTAGLVIDRAVQWISNPRGTTLLATAGMTTPGLTVSCAHDGFDYYASGAPPCKIDLTSLVLKHESKTDLPGRNVAHALVLQNAVSNPVYTVVTADNLEIFSPPGDGLSAAGFSGFATIGRLYVNGAYRDNLSLNSVNDWRLSDVDLIYAGRDNVLFAAVGGFNIYSLKAYSAVRNGVSIYGPAGGLGVNYVYGAAIDTNGQHGVSYDERDATAVWNFIGGNTAENSQSSPGTYSDIYVGSGANSRLIVSGGFRFGNALATGGKTKFNIEFQGGGNTVDARDTVVQGGAATTANGFTNSPGQVLGKGAAVPFEGGLRSRTNGGIDTVFGYDGSTNRATVQVFSGGTATTVGTGTYDWVIQPSGGNVAIGTTNPGAKLDVAGTLRGQMLVLGSAPTATNIPASYWTVVKRTDDASVKICANDGGTIKCAAMVP